MTPLSRRRRLLYALMAAVLSSGVILIALVAADVYVHWRTQDVAGVNVWGYRGAPAGRKAPGEIRIAMVGGSTVFGWGLSARESIAAFLERRLNSGGTPRRFSVINLGAPGQGAYGFAFDLADYEYLDYDIVCLYEGYNDLGPLTQWGQHNYLLWRRQSPVFRWTGYHPILPLVLDEKATAMLRGGDINTPAPEVAFQPGLATRATAGAMRAAASLTLHLGAPPGTVSAPPDTVPTDDECAEPWSGYCGSVRRAVEWARERHKPVLVVTQPYISDAHVAQQANLASMLRARFGDDVRVRYVNLGHAVDLRDRDVAYDGLHLIARGNDTIAAGLVDPVLASAGLR